MTIKRRYQEAWENLKRLGNISMIPTRSTNPEKLKEFIRATRRGMQKEKYKDDNFRKLYPNAEMTSEVEGNKLRFTLKTNEITESDLTIVSTEHELTTEIKSKESGINPAEANPFRTE